MCWAQVFWYWSLLPLTKKITKTVNQTTNKVKDFTNKVVNGRFAFGPNILAILKQYGDIPVVGITIFRHPLAGLLVSAIDTVSGFQFKKNIADSPYDKLFHLRIDITFDNNNVIALEKTSQIAIYPNPILKQGAEQKVVSRLPQGLKLSGLLEGAKKMLGADFLTYDAVDNNCQDFIIAVLQGSKIGDNSDYEFVKQDTDLLFSNSHFDNGVRNVAKKLTDLGGYVDTVIHGANIGYGIGENEVLQSVIFKRPEWTLKRAVNWLKKHKYKHIVDTKPEHLRFRQHDPKDLENKGYHYITKKAGKGIEFIIGMLNSNMKLHSEIKHNKDMLNKVNNITMRKLNRNQYSDSDYSSSDSEDDEGLKGMGIEREKEIIDKMNKLRKHIDEHHRVHGGKINIAKSFKKMGSTIKKGFTKELKDLDNVEDKAEKYVTDKHGLVKDVINYGIPAVVGGIGGMAGEVIGGPAGAMAGSAMGSYAGDQLARQVDKQAGVGRRGSGIKKPRGRPRKEPMDSIHIDIDSHNAKRDSRGEGLYDKLTLQDIEHIEKLKKEHALLSGIKDKNKVKHLKSEAKRLEYELEQIGEHSLVKSKRSGIKGRGMTPLRALKIFGTTADAIYNSPAKDIKPKLMKMRGDTSDLRGKGIGPLEAMNPAVMPSEIKPLAVKKARGAGFKKGSQEAIEWGRKMREARLNKKK